MRANQYDIDRYLKAGGGLLLRKEHPQLVDSIAHLVRQGRLQTVLPGVYAEPELADLPLTRMRAAVARDPDAVLTGAAAARLSFWRDVAVEEVAVSSPTRRAPQRGFTFARRSVPPELVTRFQGQPCTVPALTALDLCAAVGGNALDEVLRSRMATLTALHEALRLTGHRRGNQDRRRLLLDSRDDAWSPAEREAHRLFRAEGIRGWVGNYPLPLTGVIYYLDIAFPRSPARGGDRRSGLPLRPRGVRAGLVATERPGAGRVAGAAPHRRDAHGASADRGGHRPASPPVKRRSLGALQPGDARRRSAGKRRSWSGRRPTRRYSPRGGR